MKKYIFSQTFTIIVAIILVITFYILLQTAVVKGNYEILITPMILIILSIIGLAIFSVLTKIEFQLRSKKR